MSDLLASHNQNRTDERDRKRKEEEFESMTIFRMRQVERERLAEQIRREEDGVA
jgi:DnaJ family protein C protein 17